MTKSKYIFEQLARPEDGNYQPDWFNSDWTLRCKNCHNPDFFKPEGMHWILARCPEKNIRVKIDIHPTGSEIVISSAINDFSKQRKRMTFYNPDELCGHLFDLVYDFLKGGRT
jgi:hypothetical protein